MKFSWTSSHKTQTDNLHTLWEHNKFIEHWLLSKQLHMTHTLLQTRQWNKQPSEMSCASVIIYIIPSGCLSLWRILAPHVLPILIQTSLLLLNIIYLHCADEWWKEVHIKEVLLYKFVALVKSNLYKVCSLPCSSPHHLKDDKQN